MLQASQVRLLPLVSQLSQVLMVLQASLVPRVTLVSRVWLLSRLPQVSQVSLVLHVSWFNPEGPLEELFPLFPKHPENKQSTQGGRDFGTHVEGGAGGLGAMEEGRCNRPRRALDFPLGLIGTLQGN